MESILKSKRKIRFQDCDPFNHLNNSKYLDYFLNAREDQIAEHYGLDVFKNLETTGMSWVVVSNQINYIKPALTMETVLIETQLIHFTNNVLLVEMKMWNENETELKAILWMKFIQFNIHTKRVASHSDELMDLFKTVVLPVEHVIFEERCSAIIQGLRSKLIV